LNQLQHQLKPYCNTQRKLLQHSEIQTPNSSPKPQPPPHPSDLEGRGGGGRVREGEGPDLEENEGESSYLDLEEEEEASDPDPFTTYLVGAAVVILISGGVHGVRSQGQWGRVEGAAA
jgi:hypothetical protein